MKQIYFLIITVFMISCMSKSKDDTTPPVKAQINNPLDLILGEKLLNESSGDTRQNNFSDFFNISRENLIQESDLYSVTSLDKGFFIINQKRTYLSARSFSVLLKTEDKHIVKYHVMNDFQIIDQFQNDSTLFILYGNFGNYSEYWETNNDIQFTKFDKNLEPKWTYIPKSNQFPLEGIRIEEKNGYTNVIINVMVGCHICSHTYELKIDNHGNCFSANEIFKSNLSSPSIDENIIDDIFKITKNKRKGG